MFLDSDGYNYNYDYKHKHKHKKIIFNFTLHFLVQYQ